MRKSPMTPTFLRPGRAGTRCLSAARGDNQSFRQTDVWLRGAERAHESYLFDNSPGVNFPVVSAIFSKPLSLRRSVHA